jgi:hypothetical protein
LRKSGRSNDWLQHATLIVGLFAGLATLVYLTGGVVMALRLRFVDLPWANVVSQLPREFLISIGAGQVLFPALLVGALYGLFRLLRADRAKPPELCRWRAGPAGRAAALGGYARTLAAMASPLAVILILRLVLRDDHDVGTWWVVALGLLVLAGFAISVHEARAAVILSRHRAFRRWNSVTAIVAIAAIYSAAAVPAMMAAAASVSLTSAKVCDVDNFSEHGFLVGETSDRVYLGEEGHRRRIAVLPMTKVAEIFIGEDAAKAHCEIISTPPTPAERRGIESREGSDRSNSFLTP